MAVSLSQEKEHILCSCASQESAVDDSKGDECKAMGSLAPGGAQNLVNHIKWKA